MRTSLVNAFNAGLLEETYERWKRDPASVDANWSAFFEGFELGASPALEPGPAGALLKTAPEEAGALPPIPAIPAGMRPELPLQTRVDGLVYAYRTLGHTIARLDPLRAERPEQPLLSLRELGFSEKDLDLVVASKFFRGGEQMRLREMIDALRGIYCGAVGVEFMHIQNGRVRNWIRDLLESRPLEQKLSAETQKAILRELLEAESFEHFLHTRYVGQKRFSLEGAESLMVILQTLLEESPGHGVEEIVMGMAHRGRLTVLANFLKKSLRVIFSEFSENYLPELVCGDGDVKYHLGYQSTRATRGGKEVEIRLSSNPSHLEAGDPVVIGMARARQRVRGDTEERAKVLPLLIHGDAAFAGQGIVAEVLNFSQLPGYKVGGTLHVIVNNQIGFTTLPSDARSSAYATDVAKMIEAPVFHVNGDDPLAVWFVTQLAFTFRQQFHRDAVVDMLCYRRYGHNEGDEPNFTQPDLYALIDKHPSVGKLFARRLADTGVLSAQEADALDDEYEKKLETTLEEVRKAAAEPVSALSESTAVFQPPYAHDPVETGVPKAQLDRVVAALTRVPEGFHVLPKLQRLLLDRRAKAHAAGGPYDWAFGEALAFGSLLLEGTPVRLSGQDSQRGTFSQRHAVLYDAQTRAPYTSLQHVDPQQARLCIYNSLLSEAAVLGFDYGYSLNFPTMLCLWEAQFGDFANGAQVIIDQFIASAESKWQRPSGIVLLLPHGYEGQGPEHSSARIERFLQLCAEENLQVADPTTPAQYFHLLRRQMKRPFRKPLIVFTPKSLLRAEACVSTVEDFTQGRFHEILPGPLLGKPEEVNRIVFCTGKVYYDLLAHREAQGRSDTALIRIEQLYPLHTTALKEAVARFPQAERFVWCQEEPQNMGTWTFIAPRLGGLFNTKIAYAGRGEAASPAVGALALHRMEQKQLVEDAFQ
ncbi:MAG: 2-oxoglutarate dehydrogenase E1 component [Verrucomicrobiota bacterium]